MPSRVSIAVKSQAGEIPSSTRDQSKAENSAIYAVLGIFAVLLALITSRHEMYLDEAQAWLIARDSRSLFDLSHVLHYEGHPALWYLLLFIPAHLSSGLLLMQCINYALAVGTAWLILSWRNQPIMIRALLVFGVTVFFTMGVLARSYMLGGFLLIAAARCLMARQPRHWLAMSLLALAINTHFFAVPVALSIFVWLYWLAPGPVPISAVTRMKEARFQGSGALLCLALIACYLTLHPAADISTHYPIRGAGWVDYLVLAAGRLWRYFVPFAPGLSAPTTGHSALMLSRWGDVFLAIACLGLALAVLPGRRSRWFMTSASLLWMAAVVATVHIPLETHCSYLVVAYVIALNTDAHEHCDHSWLPAYAAQPVLLIILTMQVSLCVIYCADEWQKPFSGTESTAVWLKNAGLSKRPLVIQPEIAAPALIGYLGVRSAYLPSCSCNHSYVIYRQGWDRERQVTAAELQALQSHFGVSPVLISKWRLAPTDLDNLRLRLLYTSPHGWAWDNENVFVYGSDGEANGGVSETAR